MQLNFSNIIEDVKTGIRKADVAQRISGTAGLGYGQSILDPRFKQQMRAMGVTARATPAQFLGAYTSRLVVDAANDGSRAYWWRYNNPFYLGQRTVEAGIKDIKSPTSRGLAGLAVAIPATAAAGTYNLLNPGEMFRPTGYAQSYSEPGSQDRRQTAQPLQELVDRFVLGRTGEPLKYETAKQDIPSLTPQRYANYMNFRYQDKGLLGLGVLKATGENLQGVPEARLLGFPITIPMAGGYAVGSLAASQAIATGATPKQKAIRGIAAGFAGSLAGVTAGNLINMAIATANRPQLETLANYQSDM